MNQTLRNYEIVSIAERERVLITVDREEIEGEWPHQIHGATLHDGNLVLECNDVSGQPYELCFLDLPVNESQKLMAYQPSLCGIAGGRVDFAKTFPNPNARPGATMGMS